MGIRLVSWREEELRVGQRMVEDGLEQLGDWKTSAY